MTLSTIGIINNPSTTIQTHDRIIISPDGTKAYIENSGNNSVSIIDMATLTVTGVVDDTVAVFGSPSWTSSSEGTFQIYRDSKLVGTVHGQGSLTFTDNNLKSKKTYNYRVVVLSSVGSALAEGTLSIKTK